MIFSRVTFVALVSILVGCAGMRLRAAAVVQNFADGIPDEASNKATSEGSHPEILARTDEIPGEMADEIADAAGGYHLAIDGADTCDFGSSISESVCKDAAASVKQSLGKPDGGYEANSWDHLPTGCSVRIGGAEDWKTHFNRKAGGKNNGVHTLVCTENEAPPQPPEPIDCLSANKAAPSWWPTECKHLVNKCYKAGEQEHEFMRLLMQERTKGFTCPPGDGRSFGPNDEEVELDCRLFQSVRKWAECSNILGVEDHYYPDSSGSTNYRRNSFEGYQDGTGENIAWDPSGNTIMTPQQAIDIWKSSSTGHCGLLYGTPRFHVGIGFFEDRAVFVPGKNDITTDKSCY